MENPDLFPMTILKLKQIHHCKKCFKQVQKKLLEVNGVVAASVDEEKKLVSVGGKVDPWVLIKAIEENGNSAELLSYEKEPTKTKSYSESTASEIDSMQQNGREKKSYSFWKGKFKKDSSKKKKEKEEHKIEDYEPLQIDPQICRDPFCKLHKRRPIITSQVPSRDCENHPHHTGRGLFPAAHFHHTNPDMEAPLEYSGFRSRRPPPHRYTFYGNGNPNSCNMM